MRKLWCVIPANQPVSVSSHMNGIFLATESHGTFEKQMKTLRGISEKKFNCKSSKGHGTTPLGESEKTQNLRDSCAFGVRLVCLYIISRTQKVFKI